MQEPERSKDSVPLTGLEALGSLLRQTREARGLTLAEVANDTLIRSQYLQALEEADLSKLPEPVYVQGFIKRYANYLGLEGEMLSRQALPLLLSKTPPEPSSRIAVSEQPAFALRPFHLWAGYVVLVVLAVGGLSALLDGRGNSLGNWLAGSERSQLQPQAANSSERNPEAKPTLRQMFPTLEQWTHIKGVFPDVVEAQRRKPVRLDIRVVEHPSWLRVIADGKTVFEATLQPGAELNWEAERSIVLRTGNAGGVLVTFNDRHLGTMGRFGEVKEVIFEPGLEIQSLQ